MRQLKRSDCVCLGAIEFPACLTINVFLERTIHQHHEQYHFNISPSFGGHMLPRGQRYALPTVREWSLIGQKVLLIGRPYECLTCSSLKGDKAITLHLYTHAKPGCRFILFFRRQLFPTCAQRLHYRCHL